MRERLEKGRFVLKAWMVMMVLFISLIIGFCVILREIWNVSFHSAGFGEITAQNALLLGFSILSFGIDYRRKLKEYHQLFLSKMNDILAQVCTGICAIVVIATVIVTVQYSWNFILPQLLRAEFIQISLLETGIVLLFFQLLLTTRKKEEEEPKKFELEPVKAEEIDEILEIMDLEESPN